MFIADLDFDITDNIKSEYGMLNEHLDGKMIELYIFKQLLT